MWGRSPGMDALPGAKSLQLMQLGLVQALEKMINQPMVAPPSLRGSTAPGLPAAITYVADTQGAASSQPTRLTRRSTR